MAKYTFLVTDKKTGRQEKFSGYGVSEEAARENCRERYVDCQLGDVKPHEVEVGACVSAGEGPGMIECEGCSA